MSILSRLARSARELLGRPKVFLPHPVGHFYSPVVNPREIASARVWSAEKQVFGIDFNDDSTLNILEQYFPKYIAAYDYPENASNTSSATQFYSRNSQFGWLDARTYLVLMLAWRPKRIIEVGSGFSTLLAADVNRRHFDSEIALTCIEPHPRQFLLDGVQGVARLIKKKVQEVALVEFEVLQAGDILFLDSSHVSKTDSDVNYLVLNVLPRLASGVRIHFHDIYLPYDYPAEWVLQENRSWNEQYLLQALLMYSTAFAVEFSCSYAFAQYPEKVRTALATEHCFGGSSLWLTRL